MRVYVDTGVFFDSLIDQTTHPNLRTVERRGRAPALLRTDARELLQFIQAHRIRVVDLTAAIVRAEIADRDLRRRGVRAADALHITTAIAEGAQLFITGDSRLMALDGVFAGLRCVDTDAALPLLA